MRIISRTIPLLAVMVLGAAFSAHAQTNLSAFFGVGTAYDSSTGGCTALDYPDEPAGPCTYNGFSTGGYSTPTMSGIFGVFGADFMFSHHLGVGGEYTWRFAQEPYADVTARPEIYDFNVIYHPISNSHFVPEIQGGVGGFETKFYFPNQCSSYGCTGAQYLNSADHFQVHGGVGVKIYVHGGIFIKPQFDIHYVIHLSGPINSDGSPTEQFGSDWVPEGTVSIGYTFGER